jgi:hypothetical protein
MLNQVGYTWTMLEDACALAVDEHDLSGITIYPNPAGDVLNIRQKNGVAASSIGIYNALGQRVMTISGNHVEVAVDISRLDSGVYFLRISSDKGISTSRFIKQ